MSAWRKTGLIPSNPQEVLIKLPNRPSTPPENARLQLSINDNGPLDLLVGAGNRYVERATEIIKNAMLGSPAKEVTEALEWLNAHNAILSKSNSEMVVDARTHKEAKKGKKKIGKVRYLSKADADKLREEEEAEIAAERAHKRAIGLKRQQQALKKAQEEVEKAERAEQRVTNKNAKDTNAEMARMARSKQILFK